MDQLRGLAIVLVITFHAQVNLDTFAETVPQSLSIGFDFFEPFRMPLLMFLSGMLLTRSLAKPARGYFLGKLRGIGWPYLLWSLVFLAVSARLTIDTLARIPLVPPTYLWYLWFLLAYYAIAWLMVKWHIPMWVGLAVALIGAFGPDVFRASRFCFLFLFFVLGHLYSAHRERVSLENHRGWLLPVSLATVAVFGVASAWGAPLLYDPVFVIAPLGGIVLGLLLAPSSAPGVVRRALGWIGRDSIVFYVTHFVALWIAGWWLVRSGVTDPWIHYFVTVTTAFAVGWALTWARNRNRFADALFRFPEVRRAEATA
ncbi:acyltransferase family protein [Planctomonas psychrotolerans]|uniref:acyltransferase family protein n=1 Tax=Planctomonas psychrotolerans TaxID=2528712 RepID=UPI00123B6242|nr:acyltransferase [Planctomonas psychrotolerans]